MIGYHAYVIEKVRSAESPDSVVLKGKLCYAELLCQQTLDTIFDNHHKNKKS